MDVARRLLALRMVLQKAAPAPKHRNIPWRCHRKWVTARERARLEKQIIHPVEDSAIGTTSQLYVCVV